MKDIVTNELHKNNRFFILKQITSESLKQLCHINIVTGQGLCPISNSISIRLTHMWPWYWSILLYVNPVAE